MGLFTRDIETMDDLFVHQPQDVYHVERKILKALPKMIDKASSVERRAEGRLRTAPDRNGGTGPATAGPVLLNGPRQALPISTPAASTSEPPSTTCIAARRNGVSM